MPASFASARSGSSVSAMPPPRAAPVAASDEDDDATPRTSPVDELQTRSGNNRSAATRATSSSTHPSSGLSSTTNG